MYYIGVCDDGKKICSIMEEMILQYGLKRKINLEVETWYTGEGICKYLEDKNPMDILFLNIELPKMNGIQVANFIRNQLENRWMQIIYISAQSSYAQQLFKTQPMDFLTKPITMEHIQEDLDLAIRILDKKERRFGYRRGREYYYVSYGEILYFSSEGRKVVLKTLRGEEIFYGNLKIVEKKLPPNFIVIHQSYIVNYDFVVRYSYEFMELIDGTYLTISKINRKKVRERVLQEYWNEDK